MTLPLSIPISRPTSLIPRAPGGVESLAPLHGLARRTAVRRAAPACICPARHRWTEALRAGPTGPQMGLQACGGSSTPPPGRPRHPYAAVIRDDRFGTTVHMDGHRLGQAGGVLLLHLDVPGATWSARGFGGELPPGLTSPLVFLETKMPARLIRPGGLSSRASGGQAAGALEPVVWRGDDLQDQPCEVDCEAGCSPVVPRRLIPALGRRCELHAGVSCLSPCGDVGGSFPPVYDPNHWGHQGVSRRRPPFRGRI